MMPQVPYWSARLPPAPPPTTAPLPARTDVVIIGGGIVGVAAAHRLAGRGLAVLLLEKQAIAGEQSGRNWGFVSQQGRAPAELPLMVAANRLWCRMSAELGVDIEWVQGGNLALAEGEAAAARYREWAAVGQQFGLGTRILTAAQVAEALPGVRTRATLGLLTPSDGHANPLKATLAIAGAAAAAGARVVTDCAATAITTAGGRVIGVETERGPVHCQTVVCAAGRWSRRLLGTAGVDLPQNTVRETVLATEPVPGLTTVAVWGPDLAFRQMPSGALVISGEAADMAITPQSLQHLRLFFPTFWHNRRSFHLQLGRAALAGLDPRARRDWRPGEPEPNPRVVATLTDRFAQWFPQRPRPQVAQAWAGVIDGTPDLLPVVQALDAPRGLIVATGLSGHGFALGPILGEVVADLATAGSTPFDLRPLRLSRFAKGDYERAKSIL